MASNLLPILSNGIKGIELSQDVFWAFGVGEGQQVKKRKRVMLSLSDRTQDELEDWAEQEGRPSANLAGFIIESTIARAKESGEYKPSNKVKTLSPLDQPKGIQELLFRVLAVSWADSRRPIEAFAEDAVMDVNRVQEILNGDRPTDDDIIALTRMVPDWTESDLRALIKQQYNGNGDRKRQPARK